MYKKVHADRLWKYITRKEFGDTPNVTLEMWNSFHLVLEWLFIFFDVFLFLILYGSGHEVQNRYKIDVNDECLVFWVKKSFYAFYVIQLTSFLCEFYLAEKRLKFVKNCCHFSSSFFSIGWKLWKLSLMKIFFSNFRFFTIHFPNRWIVLTLEISFCFLPELNNHTREWNRFSFRF